MLPVLKKDAPTEMIAALQALEDRADRCAESLQLLRRPWNIAVWGMLVGGIRLVEQEIAAWGDNSARLTATLINVGRLVPIAIKWAVARGLPASRLASQRWTFSLQTAVDEAVDVARNYDNFLVAFPLWHKDRYAAELLAPNGVRFTVSGGGRERQVSAYQKGFRPIAGTYQTQRPSKPPQPPEVQRLFQAVMEGARKTGQVRFEYGQPWDLWDALLPEYRVRMDGIVRRADNLALGPYVLRDFKRVYGALLAVCAGHEFLCFLWEQRQGLYPVDSAVMVRSRSAWVGLLAGLSGISQEQCEVILGDLTFDYLRSLDLHVTPFVPLDAGGTSLALAPQFPLHSRPDENLLRVLSAVRREVFDATTLEKEAEMFAELQSRCPQRSFRGPIQLPAPTPDIDLLAWDEDSSTVLIGELKWVRKSNRSIEYVSRDAKVSKGLGQLRDIRDFVAAKPAYLSGRGFLPQDITAYRNVYYVLAARDHWMWAEPADGISIVEFEEI